MAFLSGRASLTKKQKLQKYTCTITYANGTMEAHMDGFTVTYTYIRIPRNGSVRAIEILREMDRIDPRSGPPFPRTDAPSKPKSN